MSVVCMLQCGAVKKWIFCKGIEASKMHRKKKKKKKRLRRRNCSQLIPMNKDKDKHIFMVTFVFLGHSSRMYPQSQPQIRICNVSGSLESWSLEKDDQSKVLVI